MAWAIPYLASIFLIFSLLNAYCLLHCVNNTFGIERLSKTINYIRLTVALQALTLRLFWALGIVIIRSATSNSGFFSTFIDIHPVKCDHSVLSTAFLQSRRKNLACNSVASSRKVRSIRWYSEDSTLITFGSATTSRSTSAASLLVLVLWRHSEKLCEDKFENYGTLVNYDFAGYKQHRFVVVWANRNAGSSARIHSIISHRYFHDTLWVNSLYKIS